MEQLSVMVGSLSIDADDNEIIPVRDTAVKAGTTEAKLDEIVNMMYQRCQDDWSFAPCSVRIANHLATLGLEAEGVKFRSAMLRAMQADFKSM